jgi:hypothetical protein
MFGIDQKEVIFQTKVIHCSFKTIIQALEEIPAKSRGKFGINN